MKLVFGLMFALLVGCENRATEVSAPNGMSADGSVHAFVGETHELDAYTDTMGCDTDGATVHTSNPLIASVEPAGFRDIVETRTGSERVNAMVALVHAVGPGTATIYLTCDEVTTTLPFVVEAR